MGHNPFFGWNTGTSSSIDLLNGTADINIRSIKVQNMTENLYARADSVKQLNSSQIQIADVNQLQNELDATVQYDLNNKIPDCNGLISETTEDITLTTLDSGLGLRIASADGTVTADTGIVTNVLVSKSGDSMTVGTIDQGTYLTLDNTGDQLLVEKKISTTNGTIESNAGIDLDLISESSGAGINIDNLTGNVTVAQDMEVKGKMNNHEFENSVDINVNGVCDITQTEIKFDDVKGEFTISPVGADYCYYYRGIKTHKSAPESVLINKATEGLWYFFFTNGVLTADTTRPDIKLYCLLSVIYWSVAQDKHLIRGESRYQTDMGVGTRIFLGAVNGLSFSTGLPIGYVESGDTSLNTSAQVSFSSGTLYQENIEIKITTPSVPGTSFSQDLSLPAQIPILYRIGTTFMRMYDTTDFPCRFGGTRLMYNLNTGGVWSVEEVGNTNYVSTYIYGTSNIEDPILGLLGQDQYTTLANAQDDNAAPDLGAIPANRVKILYRIIYQTAGSYSNDVAAVIRDVIDLRSSGLSGSTYVPITHESLSGRSDGNQHPATAITVSSTSTFSELWVGATGASNTFVNTVATAPGSDNVGVGRACLPSVTGDQNTGVGAGALFNCTSGSSNCSFGDNSATAIITGSDCTCLGQNADVNSSSAVNRISLGHDCLNPTDNTCQIGDANLTAVMPASTATCNLGNASNRFHAIYLGNGANTIQINSEPASITSNNAIVIGNSAGNNLTSGDAICVGTSSGSTLTDESSCIAIGSNAMQNNSGGDFCVCIGSEAGRYNSNTTGRCTAIGYRAADGSVTSNHSNTTAVGFAACGNITTGLSDTAVGASCLNVITSGSQNTACGYQAGVALTTADDCTAIGYQAMLNNQTGNSNTYVGSGCGKGVATNSNSVNTGVGALCMNSVEDSVECCAFGQSALLNLSSGDNHCAFGRLAGTTLTTGSNCTLIGHDCDVSAAAANGQIVIGALAVGTADNTCMIGNSSLTSIIPNSGASVNLGIDANPFQYITIKQIAAASVASPSAGNISLFLDTDGDLKYKVNGGTVRTLSYT
jgi:hypothetical protein